MQEKIILTLCREGDGITSAGADWTTHIFEYSTAFYLYLPKKKKKIRDKYSLLLKCSPHAGKVQIS